MTGAITIRPEQAGDEAVIADIVRRAYADIAYSDHREHIMVERLRRSAAFLPDLSLIAEIAGVPAGHVLLTRAQIRGPSRVDETLALAPLSVVPGHQRRGVGMRLVRAAHRQAAALGFGSIVLVGSADYYARFGYEPLGRYPIALPFEAPAADRMILALSPGALDGVRGTVDHAPDWLEH